MNFEEVGCFDVEVVVVSSRGLAVGMGGGLVSSIYSSGIAAWVFSSIYSSDVVPMYLRGVAAWPTGEP